MLYSLSCEYAIRALTYLAQRPAGKLTLLGEIAEAEGIPRAFLAKVLQDLVREGLLRSARGPAGGYALADSPENTSLYEIRRAVDGVEDLERCAVGLDPCTDDTPCPLHEMYKPLKAAIERYLRQTTVADLARGIWEKRALIAQRALRDY